MAARRPKPGFGVTEPRVFTPPLRRLTRTTTRGFEVIDFAEQVLGLTLTPWQKWLYVHALELTPDGRYRFRTLVILIARQNGKTTWLQVLALWALYIDGAKLVLGTAQNLDVAEECWAGAVEFAEGIPELATEIAGVDRTNGKKALRLATGERYKVAAASRRGGRGLSGDLVALDELREHQTWDAWAAISKTTMAREDALVVGLSNAGDARSVVLSHLRDKALADIDAHRESSLGVFEYSAPDGCDLDDEAAWAMANPSLGYTGLTAAAIRAACETDPEAVFRTEVLCQWVETVTPSPFPWDKWADCMDDLSEIDPDARLAFAVDVSWDRSTTHILVCGDRPDGLKHIQIVASGEDTEWVRPWFAERLARYRVACIAVQGNGAPASSLVEELRTLDTTVKALNGTEIVRACGTMYDAIVAGRIRHIGQDALEQAVATAVSRPLGDAWALDRKKSPVDIAPLVAATEALYALMTAEDDDGPSIYETRGLLVL